MSKFFYLAFGAIFVLGGIALVVTGNVAIGIVLIALSCGLDLLFVKDLLAERERASKS
jgi:membrane protein implicated in regulation of membrane protease activity